MTCVSPIRSSLKENLSIIYIRRRIVGGSHTHPRSQFQRIQLTQLWLTYLQKTQYAYMSYITTYLPSGTHTFNTAWTTLHTLQECIHALCKSPQDTPRSPHALGARS
jgi:hypothetical protein